MAFLRLLFIFIFFAGCVAEEGYKLNLGSKLTSNIDCDETAQGNFFVMAQEDSPTPETCSQLINYHCDAEVISSNIGNAKEQETVCLKENNCVQVTKYSFENSAGDPENREIASELSGSDSDYSCYLKDYLNSKGVYRFRGRAQSIDKAIEVAKSQCLKGAIK